MTEQTWWLVGAAAVLAAAAIGFFIGRSFGGARKRLEELESEVSRQKDEISGYKREVESHFDKTANLVASMAGSYRDLFEHLSSGYEKLASGSTQDLFRERVTGLLLGGAGGAAASAAWADSDVPLAESIDQVDASPSAAEHEIAEVRDVPLDGDDGLPTNTPSDTATDSPRSDENPRDFQDTPPEEDASEPAEKTFGDLDKDTPAAKEREISERN